MSDYLECDVCGYLLPSTVCSEGDLCPECNDGNMGETDNE